MLLKLKPRINKKGFGRLHNNFTWENFKGIISYKVFLSKYPWRKFIRESMSFEALKGVRECIFLIPYFPFLQSSIFLILIPFTSEMWLEIWNPFPSTDRLQILVPFSFGPQLPRPHCASQTMQLWRVILKMDSVGKCQGSVEQRTVIWWAAQKLEN